MHKKLNKLFSNRELVTGLLVLVITASVVAGFRWSYLYNGSAISSDEPVHLYLDEQTDLAGLTDILVDSGLVEEREEFEWAAKITRWRSFQKGHYLIDRGYSPSEFLSKLAKGMQDPVSVTILPGRSEARVVDVLASNLKVDSLAIQQTLKDSSFLTEQNLSPREVVGRLYPNTYNLYWTTSPETVIKRILDVFDRTVVQQHQDRLQELDMSVNEILTIASIVEWEANNDDEKKIISGLYWNRLEQGMRLQSDPTINFAVGERRRLHYKDYKVDHPYNTYLIDGLPPGPITNPGMTSIEAALYPGKHDFLYMVASPEGDHVFSRTFEEHKQKSAKWRQWLQEQYRIKEQRESN